jgi:hypothetical protein
MEERMSRMLNEQQINEIMEGCAFLEYYGNLYEYIGTYDGKLFFQNVNDDSHVEMSYEQLRKNTHCDIQY